MTPDWLELLRRMGNGGGIEMATKPVLDFHGGATPASVAGNTTTRRALAAAGEQLAKEATMQAEINARGSAPLFRRTFPLLSQGLNSIPPWLKTGARALGPAGMAVTLAAAPRYDDRGPNGELIEPARPTANQLLGRAAGAPVPTEHSLPAALAQPSSGSYFTSASAAPVGGGSVDGSSVEDGDLYIPTVSAPAAPPATTQELLTKMREQMFRSSGEVEAGPAIPTINVSDLMGVAGRSASMGDTLAGLGASFAPARADSAGTFRTETAGLKYPDRSQIQLTPEDRGTALMKAGLTMMGSDSPYFAQGLSKGGMAGVASAEASKNQTMQDALAKYGIDLTRAGKLTDLTAADATTNNQQDLAKQVTIPALRAGLQNDAYGKAVTGYSAAATAQAADRRTSMADSQRRELLAVGNALRMDSLADKNPMYRAIEQAGLRELVAGHPQGGQIISDMERNLTKVSQRDAFIKYVGEIKGVDQALLIPLLSLGIKTIESGAVLSLEQALAVLARSGITVPKPK